MNIRFNNTFIRATPDHMAQVLAHIGFKVLLPMEEPKAGEYFFLFRSGAKLAYRGDNVWGIQTYSADKSDGKAALMELKAAYNMHLAAGLLTQMDEVMHTSAQYRRVWCGMQGRYPNGQSILTAGS